MRLTYIAAEAADSLASNLRRAGLAALGLLVGVAAVVCVIAAGEGLRAVIVKEMGSFGRPTHLTVSPNWDYMRSTGWKVRPEPLTDEDMEAIAGLEGLVAGTSPVAEYQFKVRNGGRGRTSRIMCVSADYFPMEKLSLAAGRSFNGQDDAQLRRAAVLGASVAGRLFGESLSPAEIVGKSFQIGSFGEFQVVGVLEPEPPSLFQSFSSYDSTNNGTVFAPFTTARRFGADSRTYDLNVDVAGAAKVERAKHAILSALTMNHGTWEGQPKFSTQSGKDSLEEMNKMTGLVTTFISAVAGISLLVAGIGVMNVMLISVKERTREIGTRKALGARGKWIGNQFLIESLAVCLAGGAAGVLLAAAAAAAVARFAGWPAVVPPNAVPLALALSAGTALAFGWLPAVRASKLDPCEALRYE